MLSLPLSTSVIKVMLMKMMPAELIFSHSFSGGASGRTGLHPQDLGPYKTSRWQRATSRGGRRSAEGGGRGAARADGVRSGML